MKLLTLTHFRYEPYNAAVIPAEFISQSPLKTSSSSTYYDSYGPCSSVATVTASHAGAHYEYSATPCAMAEPMPAPAAAVTRTAGVILRSMVFSSKILVSGSRERLTTPIRR